MGFIPSKKHALKKQLEKMDAQGLDDKWTAAWPPSEGRAIGVKVSTSPNVQIVAGIAIPASRMESANTSAAATATATSASKTPRQEAQGLVPQLELGR